MGLYLGSTDISGASFKLGSSDVSALYLGSTELWSAGGLPAVIDNFDFFYSADQGSSWTDQSTSGNDGTESSFGTGGTITYTGGATPYWEFDDGTTGGRRIDTGWAPGAMGAGTDWSMIMVMANTDSTNNQYPLGYEDAGNDTLQMIAHKNDFFAANLYGGGTFGSLCCSGTTTIDQMYIVMIVSTGGSDSTWRLYTNNSLDTSSTTNDLDGTDNFFVGYDFTSLDCSNCYNKMKVAAAGFIKGYALTSTDRTDIYNYYDAIYSF